MIVSIPITKSFNEKTLLKDQDFDILQAFVRDIVGRGMPIDNERIIVNFRLRPGYITVCSYPPPMWTLGMKTMNVKTLHDKSWLDYRDRLKRWKKGGGMKVRSQDPLTGEVKTEKLSQSGFILP